MIKVLLADDNDFALRYLERLVDWESLGFELVALRARLILRPDN